MCGVCSSKDPNASNFNPEAKKSDNSLCMYDELIIIDTEYDTEVRYCNDPDALNYDPESTGVPNKEICRYCDTKKITQYDNDIRAGNGSKVKNEITKLSEEQRECLKKEICKNTNIEISACTIATDYRQQFAHLQLYLTLSKAFKFPLDGKYRPETDIIKTPTGDDFTRGQLVAYA